MAKKFLIMVCLLLICAYGWAADKNIEKMNDSLARGYLAARQNRIHEALGYFKSAATYADKAKSWRGLIDSANAFSALGRPQNSFYFLKSATSISKSKKDWRGSVAAGYAYLALPEDLNAKTKANDAFIQACEIALKNEDWRGAIEGIQGLIESGEEESARVYLKSTKELVDNLKSSDGYRALSHIYKKIGDNSLSSECFRLSGEYQKIDIKTISPPPGWKPAGPTIAGPRKVSAEAQIAMRASANKDIERKTQWLIERARNEKRNEIYSYRYSAYYTYPYYNYFYGYYSTLTPAEIYSWAAFYLANYTLQDNAYVYTDW